MIFLRLQPRALFFALFLTFFLGTLFPPLSAQAEMARWNRLFQYTHLLPSPYTVPAGHLSYGTSIAFGMTDFLQVGTNVLLDLSGFYNANAKAMLVDFPDFAFALTFDWNSFTIESQTIGVPNVQVTTYRPGGVLAISLHEDLAWYLGGTYQVSDFSFVDGLYTTSGFIAGTTFSSDIAWSYQTVDGKMSNVLAGGLSYDMTYEILGVGVSHHWTGFQLGIHYFVNADENRLLPIIVGGGSVSL